MTNVRRGKQYRMKRQDEAQGRQEASSTLTPQERLNLLDERLGVGVGASRERARLAKQIKG